MPSSGVWALSLRLTCCPGPFWRCGRAKALVERFLEITAPSRALSSLCRIDPEDDSRNSPGARAFYDEHRTAGDTHHQALRGPSRHSRSPSAVSW